jgi:FkbM family methyltransferase
MFEGWTHEVLARETCLRENDVVIDVGACIGSWTIPAAIIGKHVYAFEPNRKCCTIIGKNADLNGLQNIDLIPEVVWNKNTTVVFNNWVIIKGESSRPLTYTITLDTFCKDKRPDFIKVDVEGAELKVIEGAQHVISDIEPRMMIEVHHQHDITNDQVVEAVLNINKDYKHSILSDDGTQATHMYFEIKS